MRGVMMGDVGAVAVVQEADARLLLAGHVLDPGDRIGGGLPLQRAGGPWGDVYIDDLLVLVVGSIAQPPPRLEERMCRADAMYDRLDLPVEKGKSSEPEWLVDAWGAVVDGRWGAVGVDARRRAALAAATLCALACRATRDL